MSDYVVSLLRTLVPSLWGTALAWLVGQGLLDQVTADGAIPVAASLLVPLAIGLYYALARAVEPYLPTWLGAVMVGGSRTPHYKAPAQPFDGGYTRQRD